MTSRIVTIVGFVLLFAVGGVAILWSWLRPERFARFHDALTHVTGPAHHRVLVLLIWAWLGWHFLAR
jgi:hypothetical protein